MKLAREKKLAYVTIIVTMGYIFWRIFYTLPVRYGIASMIFGVLLLLAEMFGLIEQIIHYYMMSDIEKPVFLHNSEHKYPTIDVFIATYNEPASLLYKTINGCLHMDYPQKDKIQIYLCDDGNREEIKVLAEKMGIHYLARQDHQGAKAGNLNYGLAHSTGELIVTFDADMIPMRDFLMACVPFFLQDKKVGFVQTPQSFYNLDLFQYNLFSETSIPNEQDYFYHDIQLSKNKTNSVIYGGSNTMLSRKALEDTGGFVTSVITEDFATGMLIQAKGYQCYAIDEVHASGLAPQDLNNLVKQRRRWARGCIQSGRKLKVLSIKGLTLKQRISYLNSIMYWYDSIKRLIYMISPILFVFFGITALDATPVEILFIWLPMYIINRYTIKLLSGNRRTVHWTNIYETIMFPLLLKDVLLEMVGISAKVFSVTNKNGAKEDTRYNYKMAIPHVILAIGTLISIIYSIGFMFRTGSVMIFFLLFWLVINMYNLTIAIFFMIGRHSYRKHERFQITIPCELEFDQKKMNAMTYDISEGGCSVLISKPVLIPSDTNIRITLTTDSYVSTFGASLIQVMESKDGYRYSFEIKDIEETEYKELLQIIHDRVPPLTQFVNMEHGAIDELHINIEKRREKHMEYQRKLPRIHMNYEIDINSCTVTMTSFNYGYITLKAKENLPKELKLKLLESTIDLTYVKAQKDEYLYEIVNRNEVINDECMIDFLIELGKSEKLRQMDVLGKKEKKEIEFDEMEYV